MPPARGTLDFFGAQASARHRTRLLVVSFAVALVLVMAFIYAAMLVVDTSIAPEHAVDPLRQGGFLLFRPGLLAATALAVASVVGLGGAWHGSQLAAGGGEAVARMLGGRRVEPGTQEPLERRLANVTEEMALAAGLPVPALFVLDREPSVNAFAAGYTTGHSAVAVTRGALEKLDRDELQGVVAHELSHVLNRDTRIDLQLMAVVGGLGILSLGGRMLLQRMVYTRGSTTRRQGNPLWPVGLALLVAGAFGTLCGKLVRYAVARQREWLADASAVQFTRNPDGLAGALQKIAAEGSLVASPYAPEAAHLFFARATTGVFASILSTHPPIEERIRRIAPHLAGEAARVRRRAQTAAQAAQKRERVRPGEPGARLLAGAALMTTLPAPGAPGGGASPTPGPHVRASSPATTTEAASLLSRLPELLAAAAREPFGARALACALLVDGGDAVRAEQLGYLARNDAALHAEVARLLPALAGLGRVERMALLALSLPSLDALSPGQGNALSADLRALAAADGAVSSFELALQRVVRRRLARDAGAPPRATLRSVEEAGPECLELLANLAWAGGREAREAQLALDAGVRALGKDASWRLPTREKLGLGRLDVALTRLDAASLEVKGALLQGCVATALSDRKLMVDEAELIRATAAALGLPMPPLGQALAA